MKLTKANLTRALKSLGDTPGEVYRALRAAGRRGRRADSSRCPVAVHLARTFNAGHVVVCMGQAHVIGPGPLTTAPLLSRWLPEAAWAFVQKFDRGQYKTLRTPE